MDNIYSKKPLNLFLINKVKIFYKFDFKIYNKLLRQESNKQIINIDQDINKAIFNKFNKDRLI